MSKLERCPNCNAPQAQQVERNTPNEVHCQVCFCIWLSTEHRVLLTVHQIDEIRRVEAEDTFSYSPRKG